MYNELRFTVVSVFRAGEQGRYWYAVLGGQLEVRYHAADTKDGKVGGSSRGKMGLFFNNISNRQTTKK